MAKVELTDGAVLSAEMVEALKSFAVTEEDGKLYLDTGNLKTAADVSAVLRAKENANTELKKVKGELADANGKLKTYTDIFGDDPTVSGAELEELRQGTSGIQQRLTEAVRARKEVEQQLAALQPEYEKFKLAAEKQAAREYDDKRSAVWGKVKSKLDPKWSKRKADVMFNNLRDRFKLDADDPEDFAKMDDGRTVLEFIEEQLYLIDGYENVNGGKSHPGSGNPAGNQAAQYAAAEKSGDVMAMLNTAPAIEQ